MFYRHIGFFPSSLPRYAPLSEVKSGDSNPDSGSITSQPQNTTEEVYHNERPPVHRSRRYLAPLCVFAIGLLVGGAFGVLGSNNTNQTRAEKWTSSSADTKQFAPQMPTTTLIFSKKAALMDPPNDVNQRFWDALTPTGHGFVNISHPEAYGLLPGIPTPSGVDRYSVAMFHQLHCLGLLRHNYWRLINGMSAAWTDAARQDELRKQLRDRHSQHCFAYIAESVMCAGDLTIEWAKVERDGSRSQVDGWGVPHQCKDPEAIRAWTEENHGPAKDGSVHLHDR